MFRLDPPEPIDVHDVVCRALQTLRVVRAEADAAQRRALLGPADPIELTRAFAAIDGALDRLRRQLQLIDAIADGAGIDVVLDVRPTSRRCPREAEGDPAEPAGREEPGWLASGCLPADSPPADGKRLTRPAGAIRVGA